MNPNETMKLNLIPNSRGRSELARQYKVIDTSKFSEQPAAYVIRYEGFEISRFCGKSSILKIGSASKGIKNRYDNYNHQKDVTIAGTDLFDKLNSRSQKTNVRLMHFLAHFNHPCPIMLDVYYAKDNKPTEAIELELIREYYSQHKELPPLNFGMK